MLIRFYLFYLYTEVQEAVISSHCLETKTIAESIQYPQKGRYTKSCRNIA